MSAIDIILDGEGAWPDLADRRDDIIHLGDNDRIAIAYLAGGMQSGLASVAIRIDLPDDRKVVIVETSWRLLATAVRALAARHGWPEG
jgi:hypothetical protein